MPTIDAFTGWNTQKGDLPAGALKIADDVFLDSRGSALRRPGLVRRATLPAGTAGLYVHDDTLRAVAPDGTSMSGLYPTILLDYLPVASVAGRVEMMRLASGRRMVWIESVNGDVGKFGITNQDYAATGGELVAPGFSPLGLVGINGRAWSIDPETSRLRWSGLDNPDTNGGKGDVTSWDPLATGPGKGGYVSIASQGSEPYHIGEYRGQIAVFLRSAVLLASMDENGSDGINETISGPGTRHPGLVATVSGDLIYFDAGARFRRLDTDVGTTIPNESTIGEPVALAAIDLFPPGYTVANPPFCCYARGLGLYLAGWDHTILAGAMQPGSNVVKWSRWNLPADLTFTGMTECRGVVYLRSATGLWSFSLAAPDDEVSDGDHRPINPVVEPHPMAGGVTVATWDTVAVQGSGRITVAVVRDDNPGRAATMTGRAPKPVRRIGNWRGGSLSVRMSGAGAAPTWRIDGVSGSGGT